MVMTADTNTEILSAEATIVMAGTAVIVAAGVTMVLEEMETAIAAAEEEPMIDLLLLATRHTTEIETETMQHIPLHDVTATALVHLAVIAPVHQEEMARRAPRGVREATHTIPQLQHPAQHLNRERTVRPHLPAEIQRPRHPP